MPRLDKEKQKKLEPKRMQFALDSLRKLNIEAVQINESKIEIKHDGNIISFWPYSGWHSGKSIKDGRGIEKLLKQFK